jgi:hypothetical protein
MYSPYKEIGSLMMALMYSTASNVPRYTVLSEEEEKARVLF